MMFNRKTDAEPVVNPAQANLLEAIEGSKDIFAMLGGMRQQAIDSGFSEEVAELLVLEMIRKNGDN